MKNNWPIKKLAEIGTIFNGNSINEDVKRKKYLNKNGGLSFIATKDIDQELHSIDYDNGVRIPFGEKGFKVAHKGSVLICAEGGNAGKKMAQTTQDVYFGNKLFALETNNLADPKFVFYWYLTPMFAESYKAKMRGLIGGVSMNNFKNLLIPLPPLSEQKRIVKLLDEIFKKTARAQENTKKNLQNSNGLFESYLQKIFLSSGKGWTKKMLGEVLKLEYGKPLPKSKRKADGKYPVYGANGEKDRSDDFYCDKYSFIVGRKGSAGELNLTKKKFWPLDVTYFITFDNKKYDLKFLYNLFTILNLPRLAKGIKPGINRNDVYSIEVDLPTLKEQVNIVRKIDALAVNTKILEDNYEQKLANLGEFKKSILKMAFINSL